MNNAGGSPLQKPLTELPKQEWDNTLALNLTAIWECTCTAARLMENGGKVVNISSIAAEMVIPGSGHYAMGSPLFRKATIHLENGKTFTIQAEGNDEENIYIRDARLNGAAYTRSYLKFEDIIQGGLLELTMDSVPNKSRGSAGEDVPGTKIE